MFVFTNMRPSWETQKTIEGPISEGDGEVEGGGGVKRGRRKWTGREEEEEGEEERGKEERRGGRIEASKQAERLGLRKE